MKEPEFTQHPTEIFGYAFTNLSSEAQAARNNQFCPFLDGECRKPRKSEPEVKVGVCTVGYKGNGSCKKRVQYFANVLNCKYGFPNTRFN